MGTLQLVCAVNSKGQEGLAFKGNAYAHKEAIKNIAGRMWDPKKKFWWIPFDAVTDAVQRFGRSLVLHPSVIRILQEEQKKKEQIKRIKEKKTSSLTRIEGIKGELYPYQAAGVEFLDTIRDSEGAILAFDMGCGKTLVSLATVTKWMNEGIVKHCLVICPAALKYATWKKEIEKWTDHSYVVVDGSTPQDVQYDDGTIAKLEGRALREVQYAQWQYGVRFIIMNYELFLYDSEGEAWEYLRDLSPEELEALEYYMKHESRQKAKQLVLEEFFGEDAWQLNIRKQGKKWVLMHLTEVESILPPIDENWAVILDECHRIKNPRAKTTKRLFEHLAPAGRKILATGTPLENNIEELWSLVELCRPGLLGNYYQFRHRYLELDRWGNATGVKVYMLNELKERLMPIMYRLTKQEALPDLPELTVMNYEVEMTSEQRKWYQMVADGIIEYVKNTGEEEFVYLEALAQLTRLQQVCDSPVLLKEWLQTDDLPVESGKLRELKSIIEDLNPQENKFVLFTQYKQMADILYWWLIDEKILQKDQIGYVYGGLDPEETERIQNEFQNGKLQCVLMTTAGNYGLDLSAGSYVICYDQLFNPQKMQQIYSRCHRNGVKNAVTVINLITKDSYEEKKQMILEEKQDLFRAMIDDDVQILQKIISSKEDLLDLI